MYSVKGNSVFKKKSKEIVNSLEENPYFSIQPPASASETILSQGRKTFSRNLYIANESSIE